MYKLMWVVSVCFYATRADLIACSCFGKVKFPRGVIGEDGKQFVKGVRSPLPLHFSLAVLTQVLALASQPQPQAPPWRHPRRR